jgi:DNA-binding response OmpR family regulator
VTWLKDTNYSWYEPEPGCQPESGQNAGVRSTVSGPKLLNVKKKILVVDDDPQIRESIQKVLRADAYEVVLAADGREGIKKFDAEWIDLLLLDVNLPDTSGWDVFGKITSINPFLPIIVITGKCEQQHRAGLSGVGGLIEKPLDVARLLEMVEALLADSSEVHLQRLAGHRSDTRYQGPCGEGKNK